MKFFLRLIEAAKNTPPTIKDDSGNFISMSKEAQSRFWKHVEECQPFVFADEKTIEWEVTKDKTKNIESVQLENAPFKVFSVEMVNGVLVGSHKNDHEHIFVLCAMCVEVTPMQWVIHALVKAQNDKVFSAERVMTNVLDLHPSINMLLKRISENTVQ